MSPILRITGLARSFPDADQTRHVLSGLDLDVGAGEVIAVTGPSGSGKTTLVSLIPRFYDPDAGRITIDGVARTLAMTACMIACPAPSPATRTTRASSARTCERRGC